MQNWSEVRKHFYKEAIKHGFTTTDLKAQLKTAYPMGWSVDMEQLESWMRKLLRRTKLGERESRLVNRFKIGADPEFVFYDRDRQVRTDASRLGLKCGRAFGADTNGRLVEIRPYPTRSALQSTASILSTMRWLFVKYPSTQAYDWLAGAYKFQDGLGGHVHFGRKRPTRELELTALDALEACFQKLGMFPAEEVLRRRGGDAHGQIYGRPHDFRLQLHGYEYRTFPSWLDSPWMTFFVLTMSKLAVHAPGMLEGVAPAKTDNPALVKQKLANFLAYWKSVDDDARLAFAVLGKRGYPTPKSGDFKARWGLTSVPRCDKTPKIVPLSIEPTESDVRELTANLLHDESLEKSTITPSWKITEPPAGFLSVVDHPDFITNGIRNKGLGELLWDVCVLKGKWITFYGGDDDNFLWVSTGLLNVAGDGTLKRLKKLAGDEGHKIIARPTNELEIKLGHAWREPKMLPLARKVLLGGELPIWKIEEATPEAAKRWAEKAVPQRKYSTEVLYSVNFGGQKWMHNN